jgi:hypothetical protein
MIMLLERGLHAPGEGVDVDAAQGAAIAVEHGSEAHRLSWERF